HRDLRGPEVIALPQVDDLPDDLGTGLMRAGLRPPRPVPQRVSPARLITATPLVEGLPGDPVVAARQRNVPGDLLGMTQDGQSPGRVLVPLTFVHTGLLLIRDPRCQRCPSVLDP